MGNIPSAFYHLKAYEELKEEIFQQTTLNKLREPANQAEDRTGSEGERSGRTHGTTKATVHGKHEPRDTNADECHSGYDAPADG